MTKAFWNGKLIAESNKTILIEGNHYFPPESIRKEYLTSSSKQTNCHWKGKASYYNLEVEGKINRNAGWFYPDPKEAASRIKNYVAFWNGVKVTEE